MTFTSVHFAIFLAATATGTYLLRHRVGARNTLWLAASYYFYAAWDWRLLGLLAFTTIVHYVCGLRIAASGTRSGARGWMAVAATTAVGAISLFKYADFFIDSAAALGAATGLPVPHTALRLVLPVGLSFYSFQALSYTIDVYRGQQPACRSLRDFALFVGFFPTILSGPITRARQLLPQLQLPATPGVDAREGLSLVARGLAKKVLFADTLAAHLVSPAFDSPEKFSWVFLLVALYAYTVQIYMDLSGYTDIARGAAEIVGIRLPENFNRPYLARSLSEFWQRWHITMSSFFRDYLYFSVGGSKRGNVYVNLMATFIAIGWWHGGGWHFIIYGAIHGAVVGFERFLRQRGVDAARATSYAVQGAGMLVTFHLVVFSRLLFRAGDVGRAWEYGRQLSSAQQGAAPWSGLGLGLLVAGLLLHCVPHDVSEWGRRRFALAPTWLQATVYVGVLLTLIAFSTGTAPFVYYQF